MKINDENIMFTSREILIDLCSPLFEKTSISDFEYVRYYFNGIGFTIATYPSSFNKEFFELELHPSLSELYFYESPYVYVDENFYKTSHVKDSVKWKKNIGVLEPLKIQERFYVVIRHLNHVEIFGFIRSNSFFPSVQFYFENLPFLNSFILAFKENAKKLVSDCEKQRIKLGDNFFDFDLSQEQKFLARDGSIMVENFTARERECMSLIAKGYTMKAVAKVLTLSPRTVEQHLRNIKEKHQLHNKNQLIDFWYSQTSEHSE